MLASTIFARSQGQHQVQGEFNCYWCGASCDNTFKHSHSPVKREGFSSLEYVAKNPYMPYVCIGCWLFDRKSITIQYLNGYFVDGESYLYKSLLITEKKCCALDKGDGAAVIDFLCDPPEQFVLSLIERGEKQHLHYAVGQDGNQRRDQNLKISYNNSVCEMTVQEVKQLRKTGEASSPGTQALLSFFGEFEVEKQEVKRGRPRKEDKEDSRPEVVVNEEASE